MRRLPTILRTAMSNLSASVTLFSLVARTAPRQEAYGTVAVFEDLYGNKWDLLELKNKS